MHQFVWEYLFYYNFETGEYIPWLAEKFEYSSDYKSIKIYLRKGVKWSDGYPFTADDVVFTYEMLLKNAPKLAGSAAVAAKVAGARKIDDYTVEIVLKEPDPRFHLDRTTFPAALVWGGLTIVPKHIWEKEDPLTFKNYPPVGTGAYKVVYSGETESLLVRRDDWWATELFGIRPAPKYIICKYYGPEESIAAALAANDVDAVFIGMVTFGTLQTVMARNPEVIVWRRALPYSWLDPCPRVLMVNNQRYPWSLPEVRHAISYLLNRQMIADLVFDKTTWPTPYIFPEYGGMKPYLDAVKTLVEKYEILKYDPKKAEEIFLNLGFKKGPDGIWVTPNGTKLEAIYIYHTASDPVEQRKAMEAISSMLRAAGISVITKGLEGPAFTDTMNRGDWDFRYGYMCPGDTDPFFNLYISHSKFAAPPGKSVANWEYNGWRYINSEYDNLVDQLQMTSPLERDKAVALFVQIMEIFYRDLPVIPVVQAPALVPFSTRYWTGWPTAENPWMTPTPWWAHFIFVLTGYYSPAKNEWIGGIRPTRIDYTTVYFTKDTPKFRGIDLIWYGPFKAGDAARVPSDDAEYWISKGYASYTPPMPTLAPELKPIADQVSALRETVSALKNSIGNLSEQVSNVVTLLTVNLVITLLLIVAVLYIAFKKK